MEKGGFFYLDDMIHATAVRLIAERKESEVRLGKISQRDDNIRIQELSRPSWESFCS